MIESVIPWLFVAVMTLIGVDVILNIQNKFRARRQACEMRESMGEFLEAMAEMEAEMTRSDAQNVSTKSPVRKFVVKPADFKNATVKLPKDFGKLDEVRKAKNREKMRAYRANKRKKAVKKVTGKTKK